jgi:hypothetical protein
VTEGRFFDERSRHLDRFGPLLVLTVITVAGMSLVDLKGEADAVFPSVAATAVGTMIGVTLLLAIGAAGVVRRWRLVAGAFVAFAIVYSLIVLIVDLATEADTGAFRTDRASPVWMLIALVSPLAVVRRLVQHRRVTAATMYGAVAAYLLLAIAFAYTFLFMEGAGDAPFFTDAPDEPTTSFMYFSLVSITTVGYGDLTPAGDWARLLANTEAVIGQVYLVTFVAMLVGLMIQQREGGP